MVSCRRCAIKRSFLFRIYRLVLRPVSCAVRKLFCWLIGNRVAVCITSLMWLAMRSGFQPRRMTYPCQQAAAANVSAITFAAVAGLALPRRLCKNLLGRRILRIAIPLCLVAFLAAWLVPRLFQDPLPVAAVAQNHRAEPAADGITAASEWVDSPLIQDPLPLAAVAQNHLADAAAYPVADFPRYIVYPSDKQAVVGVAYDPNADYPETSPFNPQGNAVDVLVRRAVAELGFGPPENPLRDFIEHGYRVVIKPNIEGGAKFQCTHPSVVRTIIDIAAQAGAAEIIVAESSPFYYTEQSLQDSGYAKMVKKLKSAGLPRVPGLPPCRLVLRNLEGTCWSWVDTGAASAYPAGEFADTDLLTSLGKRTYHRQTDSHGRNPNGRVLNKNAVYDTMFDADVIINVPRLKVHLFVINTLAIKNFVGITVSSTSGINKVGNMNRVAHSGTKNGPDHMVWGFGNDILWRELANIQRAVIYWKNGEMKPAPQRKMLCILDAVCAGDGPHGKGPKVQVGYVLASVDPIAVDAVGSRLMRYDFRSIPVINNAPMVPSHPWGTNDPARILLQGDPIGPGADRLFSNPHSKFDEFRQVIIHDLEPPKLKNPDVLHKNQGVHVVEVKSEDAAVIFLHYNEGDGIKTVRMEKNGNEFKAVVPAQSTPRKFILTAHDRFFNSARYVIK